MSKFPKGLALGHFKGGTVKKSTLYKGPAGAKGTAWQNVCSTVNEAISN